MASLCCRHLRRPLNDEEQWESFFTFIAMIGYDFFVFI